MLVAGSPIFPVIETRLSNVCEFFPTSFTGAFINSIGLRERERERETAIMFRSLANKLRIFYCRDVVTIACGIRASSASRWPEYRSACLFKCVVGDTCMVMSCHVVDGTLQLELTRTGGKRWRQCVLVEPACVLNAGTRVL
jgi:hypothetical protein